MRNKGYDTSLIRMAITELAKKNNWDYDYALDVFYNSKTCNALSNEKTGVFTFSPMEIVKLVEQEL